MEYQSDKDMSLAIENLSKSVAKLRPFSFARTTKRHIALLLAYNGAEYRGLARQPRYINTIEERVIQALIHSRLIPPEILGHQTSVTRAGRTDKGVSASGNVMSVWMRSALGVDEDSGILPFADAPSKFDNVQTTTSLVHTSELPYVVMINQHLPPSIRILAYSPVVPSFSAQKDAISRTYEYAFSSQGVDINRLELASRRFIGTHDFSYFTQWSKDSRSYTRTIHSIEFRVVQYGSIVSMIIAKITAPSFIWHQIRGMMTVLIRVAQGLEDEGIISMMLQKQGCQEGSRPIFGLASPIPLTLTNVEYPPGCINWTFPHPEHVSQRFLRDVEGEKFRAVCEARFWNSVSQKCLNTYQQPRVYDATVLHHDDQIVGALKGRHPSQNYVNIYDRPFRPWGIAVK